MGEIIFVGLGLHDELGMSLRGFEEVKRSDIVFAEFYTSLMVGLSLERFEKLVGKRVHVLSRQDLEEKAEEALLKVAMDKRVALLIPGDPFIATTHIALRLRAKELKIKTKVIHGASIVTAAMGLSCLQNYKFGKSVSIPFPEPGFEPETPYDVIGENKRRDLHTLVFLDVKMDERQYMTIREALKILTSIEGKRREGVIGEKTLAIGMARMGSEAPIVKAGFVKDLINHEFGAPPHILIFPGKMHFMETEALITLNDAPSEIRRM